VTPGISPLAVCRPAEQKRERTGVELADLAADDGGVLGDPQVDPVRFQVSGGQIPMLAVGVISEKPD